MTFCMNVSRFMNLAAIFSLDLESQFIKKLLLPRLICFAGIRFCLPVFRVPYLNP